MVELKNGLKSVTDREAWAARGALFVTKVKATKAVWFPPGPVETGTKAASVAKKATKSASKKSTAAANQTTKMATRKTTGATKKPAGAAKKTTSATDKVTGPLRGKKT